MTCDANSTYSLKTRISVFEGIVDSSNFEYVPYSGNDYSISLGNAYYGGEIDLATGLMTVTHGTVVVDGTFDFTQSLFSSSGDIYRLGFTPNPAVNSSAAASLFGCNTFTPTSSWPSSDALYVAGGNSSFRFFINRSWLGLNTGQNYATVNSATKTFFASNPTQIIYPLATPLTVQLSPLALSALAQTSRYEPRLNTVYTDADSIQISYQKSPIRIATEQEQAILSLGGNI